MNGTAVIGGETFVFGPDARPEYFKLPRDLTTLTECFGMQLSASLARDAAVLAFSIECADRLLDAIPQADRRVRFSTDVVACLRGEPCFNSDVRPELTGWLAQLKEVAQRHRVQDQFCRIVRELLDNSEQMRTTLNRDRFVGCVVLEGRLMVELLLLILADVATPRFESFMRRLSEPANLGDKLRDARRDYQIRETAIRPTWQFRARLIYETCWRVLRLAPLCGCNLRLMTWGMCSVFTEFFWFRFSNAHSH